MRQKGACKAVKKKSREGNTDKPLYHLLLRNQHHISTINATDNHTIDSPATPELIGRAPTDMREVRGAN